MPKLLTLPTEILVAITAACENVQTAMRFSATNRLLRQVWLDNAEIIVVAIRDAPDIVDSVRFAKEDAFITSQRPHESDVRSTTDVPIRHWAPRLLRNQEWCSFVCNEYKNRSRPPSAHVRNHYYFIRRLALYHDYTASLTRHMDFYRAMPLEEKALLFELQQFLCGEDTEHLTFDEKIWLGICFRDEWYEYRKDDPMFDVNKDQLDWHYFFARDVLDAEDNFIDGCYTGVIRKRSLKSLADKWGVEIIRLVFTDEFDALI